MADSVALAAVLAANARIAALAGIAQVAGAAQGGGGLPQFAPGEQVAARVEAQLADGSFRINVAGQPLIAALPNGIEPGDTLALTFLRSEPRPTFALAGNSTPAAATPATLSPAGRLIDEVVSAGDKSATAVIAGARPLTLSDAPQAQPLAAALRNAVETSGLFYESHLAQWVSGARAREQIEREPQARLTPAPERTAEAPQTATLRAATTTQSPALPAAMASSGGATAAATPAGEAVRSGAPATAASTQAGAEAADTPAQNASEATIAPAALPLLRNQLDALETRQIAWHGEVWPGQLARWQIDASEGDSAREPAAPPQWRTSLRLLLPCLGEVSADLNLSAGGLRLGLHARQPEAAAALRDNAGVLTHALDAAGIRVFGLDVAGHAAR
ncbi:MAG TPA: flagellar hook-length control protein FliK [Burkholderiales bacterium]|nr:flagellar hook-length control protein FliK [Burkholderiales bacterium]